MNIFKLSWAYLIHRKLNNALSIFLVAFGALLITTLFLFTQQLQSALDKNINNIDMVVGAKGSPMQIILSSIFHIDFPTGNISLEDAEYFANHPLVREAAFISLGDSYQDHRIIGADENFYAFYKLQISEGRRAEHEMEVCIGSNIAEENELKVGDEFSSSHGFSDGDTHALNYKVVGILSPKRAIIDKLIVTPLESYWQVHHTDSEEKFITNLLIRYKSPMAALRLPAMINSTGNLQAAVPSFEAARLFSMIGIGAKFVKSLAIVLIGFAAFSIFISMYSSLNEKKYDLAIMRSLGASRLKLFIFSLLEGTVISLLGGLIGIFLAHLSMELLNLSSDRSENLMMTGKILYRQEIIILILCTLSGILGALIPSIIAYKTDISKTLSEG